MTDRRNTGGDSGRDLLRRIAVALEHLAGIAPPLVLPPDVLAFQWQCPPDALIPTEKVDYIPIDLLCGIDAQKAVLLNNTRQFAKGLPANNALLWGARGVGKSSLIKAVHAEVTKQASKITLIEIHRQDIASLPRLLSHLRGNGGRRFIVFCDDLAFADDDGLYKSLKAVLEGGLAGKPANVLFYATSNRRHMMGETMGVDDGISQRETIDEKVSLSDRFGLWLGFYAIDQATYLQILDFYAKAVGLAHAPSDLHKQGLAWARQRGDMSGRVAWQFIVDAAGRTGRAIRLGG